MADLDGTQSGLEGKDGDSLRKKLHGGVHTDLVRWIRCKVQTEVLQLYKVYGKDSRPLAT